MAYVEKDPKIIQQSQKQAILNTRTPAVRRVAGMLMNARDEIAAEAITTYQEIQNVPLGESQ